MIISPLAIVNSVLNEGEREFGATVIDMGGGQTSVATIRNQELQYTNVYQEGGDYVTKDISKVLKTSKKIAEGLKLNYGEAYPQLASKETFQVEVIGEVEPVEVTELYLAQIISARLKHIFEQIKQDLERRHLLDLPGGIALIGGNAILPGIVELAQEVLGVRVKLYVPNQVGIRNPAFAHVISLSEFAGSLTEINVLAQRAIRGDQVLRQQPIDFRTSSQEKPAASQRSVFGTTSTESAEPTYTADSATSNQSEEKPKFNGYSAITQSSLLMCSEGGCLQPIISYEIATKTASAISTNNIVETGLSTIGAIASGYLLGKGGGLISALKAAFSKSGILFTIGGVGATYAMTSFESHMLRKDKSLAKNDIYERMNEGEEKDWTKVDTYIDEAGDIAIDNTPVPADIKDANVVGTINAYKVFMQTSGDLADFKSIEKLSRQQMRKNPTAQSLLKDLNKGKHPNIVNKSKYYNNRRLNPSTRNEAISQLKDEVAKNKSSVFQKGMGVVLFFLPLVDTYFSERARKVLAEEAIKDINNTICVVTEK